MEEEDEDTGTMYKATKLFARRCWRKGHHIASYLRFFCPHNSHECSSFIGSHDEDADAP